MGDPLIVERVDGELVRLVVSEEVTADLYAALDEAVKLTEVATMRAVGTANWLPKARTVLAKARGEQ